jgi:hypothetical protein
VYVTVNGGGFHNRGNLAAQIDLSMRYLQEIRELLVAPVTPQRGRSAPGLAQYPASRARIERRIAEAEAILENLRRQR